MPVLGADVVSKNILTFTKNFLREVDRDMEEARWILDRQIGKNISLSDHSQGDLTAMGHPYALRAPQAIHDPTFQTHAQSGQLKRAKYSGVVKAGVNGGTLTAKAFVGIGEDVQHAAFVIYGTSKMVPRDFLMGSLNEVKDQIWQILRRSLNQAVVSFKGERQKL